MGIFSNFNQKAYSFKRSKKETMVSESEHWSAAILSGSDQSAGIVEPIKPNFIKYFLTVLLLFICLLLFQLFNLQIVNGQKNSVLSDSNRVRQRVIRAERGVIYDKNRQILVRNLANFDLVVVPNQLPKDEKDRSKIDSRVAQLTGLQESEISQKYLQKGLDYSQPILVSSGVDRDKALVIEENARELKGFKLDTNPIREYLDGSSLSHFLGYTGRISADDQADPGRYSPTDLLGKAGLEKSYESDLKGYNGREQIEVDSSGTPIKLLASKDPSSGNSLVLSIDKNLQEKMSQYLSEGLKQAGSKRGVAIAADPKTGHILGAVSLPTYDNNLFAKGISQKDYDNLANDPNKPLLNRATLGTYPIASTIKPLNAAAALQEKVITPSTSIEDKGKIEVPNVYNPDIVYTFKGWKPEGLGYVNVVKSISMSSDIFYYVVSGGYKNIKGLGIDRLVSYLKKFGFGKKTGIDTNEETAGYLPTPDSKKARTNEQWYIGDTYNMGIGQGNMQATPLQLLIATGAIANGGNVYKPKLVKEVISPTGEMIKKIDSEIATNNFISEENLRVVKEGMRKTVTEGTACCSIKNEVSVSVSGKTGTAETSSEGFDGKNLRTRPHAWFSSFAPSEDPQITMIVLIENSGEGAEYAVPVTKNILKWYFSAR